MRFLHGAGQGLEPSFRLPLQGILAPECLVRVARSEVQQEHCTLGDSQFRDDITVHGPDGLGEWKDGGLLSSARS